MRKNPAFYTIWDDLLWVAIGFAAGVLWVGGCLVLIGFL